MEDNQLYHQQQPGESTSSSSRSSDCLHNHENGEEKAEKERIIRTMANFMALLADMSDANSPYDKDAESYERLNFEREKRSPTRTTEWNQTTRKRRLPTRTLPSTSCTPEREIPSSSQETSESVLFLPLGTTESITFDSSAPGLIEISPDVDFAFNNTYPLHQCSQQTQQQTGNETKNEPISQEERFCRSRSWAKQKLASVIFSHPGSLRSFCVEAYQAAREQSLSTNQETDPHIDTETNQALQIHQIPRSILCNSVLLSITLESWNACLDLTLDVSFATVRVTAMALHVSVCNAVNVWEGVTRFNPVNFASRVFTRPFNMMGKTTEVVVSGIQSVATGVGSASSIALHRLSAKNRSPLSSGLAYGSQGNLRRMRSPIKKSVNEKLLRKLNNLNSTAPVVSYTELDDDNGLSRHAKSRVQRMMHYDVSLRPFVATVKLQESFKKQSATGGNFDDDEDATSTTSSPLEGPFMCTPQSFPPTPASRAHVLKRGSRFADDVVFLARDQLRVHDGLESSNERTREMAQALTHGKRLAVFDADDASAGIELSCGQHVATKVGPLLYCSLRSMVPILRNCFVYFEMTVLGRSGGVLQTGMATLSFGLSTKEMPTDTLVGAWKGSVGLCTTGQILISGQWCSAGPDPTLNSFGDQETVGCLVCLDDSSAFETWDGVMITATVTFNINGRIISPHVPSLPITGFDQHPPASAQPNPSIGTVPPAFTLPLLVPAEEELYPTLTLHSPGTSVMCRFSAGDVVARSRDEIGAPKNVPVYTVDGSLVFVGEE